MHKQVGTLLPAVFSWFWGVQYIPWHLQNHSRLLLCQKPSRIVKTEFGLFLNFQKSIFIIHALLTCFDCLFMFRIKYASYLGGLIAFWMPGSSYAMIRVSYAVLGFLYTGKIGPWDLCQWTRNNALNRTMVLDVIYITFVWFFELARVCSVEQWPTLAFQIQIGEDEVWRAREAVQERHLFFFHLLQFLNTRAH